MHPRERATHPDGWAIPSSFESVGELKLQNTDRAYLYNIWMVKVALRGRLTLYVTSLLSFTIYLSSSSTSLLPMLYSACCTPGFQSSRLFLDMYGPYRSFTLEEALETPLWLIHPGVRDFTGVMLLLVSSTVLICKS